MFQNPILKTAFLCAATFALSVFSGGCANYKLGTTLSEELRAVYVPTVINKTAEPRADSELTRALMREIQREGTLRITDKDKATTRLDVEITEYRQDSIRFSNNTSPEEYRMVLRAQAVFSLISPGENEKPEIFRRTFDGDETFTRGTDTITAQQMCLPKAAEKLAEQIVDACVSAW